MNQVRELRLQRHWTASDLALKLGVAEATVRSWERGRHQPPIRTLRKLARVLGVSVDELGLVEDGSRP